MAIRLHFIVFFSSNNIYTNWSTCHKYLSQIYTLYRPCRQIITYLIKSDLIKLRSWSWLLCKYGTWPFRHVIGLRVVCQLYFRLEETRKLKFQNGIRPTRKINHYLKRYSYKSRKSQISVPAPGFINTASDQRCNNVFTAFMGGCSVFTKYRTVMRFEAFIGARLGRLESL